MTGSRVAMVLLALTSGAVALCLLGDRLSCPVEPTPAKIERVSARVAFDVRPGLARVPTPLAPRARDTHRAPRTKPVMRGVVVDARGAPVEGVEIRVGHHDAKERVETDIRGRLSLNGYPRGHAELLYFRVPGGAVLPGPWAVSGGDDVFIVLPDLVRVRFVPPHAARMNETGIGYAVLPDRRDLRNGGVVRLKLERRPIGEDGVVYTLPAGRAMVRFGGKAGVVAADLTLVAGEETVLELAPVLPVHLTGRVLGPDGTPLVGARISDAWTRTRWARSKDHGVIVSKSARGAPGRPLARLVVRKAGFAPLVLPPLNLLYCPDLHVRLTYGGTVSVQVVWKEAPSRWCEVVPLCEPGIRMIGSKTNGDHPAVLELVPPGPLRVLIRPWGRRPIFRTVHVCEGDTTHLTVTLPED